MGHIEVRLHAARRTLVCLLLLLSNMMPVVPAAATGKADMVRLPGGAYRPLVSPEGAKVRVKPFRLDVAPVTNASFAAFVATHPSWAVQRVSSLFAEPRYLRHWAVRERRQSQPAVQDAQRPVVNVSWFAARAYCSAQGKRLPTIAEWEFAGRASAGAADGTREKDYVQRILDWYAQPAGKPLPDVMQSRPNFWGVHDMHGVIWEWTQDFNASQQQANQSNFQRLTINGRTVTVDVGPFCGVGAASVADPSDYAAFMRYSFRSSLKATFVLDTLGFRCAADDGADSG
ncbi:MAG TPA: formylglycine-generating enzyme family protein [Advenella sp.]|nr:formylglycine-generating enzyme family protein [Advenella sp.]